MKGKEKVEVVLSDEDDEVVFVAETKKKDEAKATKSVSVRSASLQPSSAPCLIVPSFSHLF